MNEAHKVCGSDEWRATVREHIIPWAVSGDVELGDDVLEVGPGYGATTEVLQEMVGRLTSVEIDPELAAALVERYAGVDHVEVVEGDATALDFPDARFSGATSFSMLHHVPTPELQDRIFAEARRVLRPGGVFVAVDSVASDDLRALHDGDTYNPIDPATVAERLRAVGFTAVDVATNELAWKAVART
ncbi:MAG TPA: class I SAM-dependent methyltransferase [Acidimicrobiales bacterium]